MSEKQGVVGRGSGVGDKQGSDTAPDRARGSGVGSRESKLESPANAPAPTTDNRQPTTDCIVSPTPDPRLPTPATANWPFLYSAVLIELAILIIIFYAFTKAFA
jgi:hypothetical protein